MDFMQWLNWLLTIGGKAIGVSATVLISLIGSGTLVEFLNIVQGIFSQPGLSGNALLAAFFMFAVALANFVPKIVAALPSGGNVTNAGNSEIAEAMRLW